MKRLYPLIFTLLFCGGCQKTIDKKIEDAIVKAMVDGQWVIVDFQQNGNNITADFNGYSFQYHSNKTVDAIKNNAIEISGKWDGNTSNKTTWANFSNASYPIDLLNGTWNIVDNSWTYVKASQTNGSGVKTFHLVKQ